jgi:hypothetical protein
MSRLPSCVLSIATSFALVSTIATTTQAAVTHNYLFNSGDGTQILDSAGIAHGVALDGAVVNTAESRLILNGTGAYGALPGPDIAINTYTATTLELWFTQTGNVNVFTAAAMLGRTSTGANGESSGLGYDYLMLQPTRAPGGEGSRGAIANGTYNAEAGVTDGAKDLNDGRLHHMVLTVDATNVGYYVDGAQIGVAPLNTFSLANVSNDLAYLGRSLYPDPLFSGSIYEFRIYDTALNSTQVQSNFQAGCTAGCGEPIRLEVNLATGEAIFKNDLTTQSVVAYSVTSASGSIKTGVGGWKSVADFGDADSGGGSIDPNDVWMVDQSLSTEISETDPLGGGGPDDGFQLGAPKNIGNLFAKSPYQDLVVSATVYDGFVESTINVPVLYSGTATSRSDFNANGTLDAADYGILLSNHLTTLAGTTDYETFLTGDVDGDGDNDFNDFRLFKTDYIAANGAAAFAALTAIPEPTTTVLAALAFAGIVGIRTRR